jgi:hypothetical protein
VKSWTLLELRLRGQLCLAGHTRPEALLDEDLGRLADLPVDPNGVAATRA